MAELNPRRIPELPTHDDYARIVREVSKRGPIGLQLDDYIASVYSQLRGASHAVSKTIVPALVRIDRVTEEVCDPGEVHQLNDVLHKGLYTGSLVVAKVHLGRVSAQHTLSAGLKGDIRVSHDPEDPFHSHHVLADDIIQQGSRGWGVMGSEAEELVETWEDELVPGLDPTVQRKFRMMVGIMGLGAYRLHEKLLKDQKDKELAQMQKELDTPPTDEAWDDWLSNL
jgi:hypothetical protein